MKDGLGHGEMIDSLSGLLPVQAAKYIFDLNTVLDQFLSGSPSMTILGNASV